MKHKLSEISTLITGYSFRSGTPYDKDGEVALVQAGDVRADASISDSEDLRRISKEENDTAAMLQRGDVVLVSRSSPEGIFRAASIDDEPPFPYLAASALTVIRLHNDDVEPRYLAAYLNGNEGQSALQRCAAGSSVRTLSLKELSKLSVSIPSRDTQHTSIALHSNIHEQRSLLKRKDELLSSILSTITSTGN